MAEPAHFYHVWASGPWRRIAGEHFEALAASGFPGQVHVGLVGDWADRWGARDWVRAQGAVVCAEEDFGWEQVTLSALRSHAQGIPEDTPVLYAHAKGSYHASEARESWRRHLTELLVTRWRDRVGELRSHDTTGAHWLTPEKFGDRGVVTPFYGGNFWWANARYLRTLPPVSPASRYDAESWVGLGHPDAYALDTELPAYLNPRAALH